MTAVAKFEKQNNIEEHEFDDIMSQIFKSFLTNGMDKSVTYWGKKGRVAQLFYSIFREVFRVTTF